MSDDNEAQTKARTNGHSRLATERKLDAQGHNVGDQEYRPQFVDTVRKLAKLGATDLEMADYIGCSKRDISRWRIEHPEFDAAIVEGSAIDCARVRRSMYELAVGYTYEEEKLVLVKGEMQTHVVRRHMPPNFQAGQFILTNRESDKWQKQPEYTPPPPEPARIERPSEDELVSFLGDLLVRTKARADAQTKATRH